jgi:hypothetical protein
MCIVYIWRAIAHQNSALLYPSTKELEGLSPDKLVSITLVDIYERIDREILIKVAFLSQFYNSFACG